MPEFTVLLRTKDGALYLAHVFGDDVRDAIGNAIENALRACSSDEWEPIFVTHGHHDDIKDEMPETINIPLTAGERRAIVAAFMLGASAEEITEGRVTSILEKLRAAEGTG